MKEQKKYSSANPNPVDIFVGARIKLRRAELGYSQEKLSKTLGITFQQIQKYENAKNRISSSKLFNIAKVLGVDVGFFFEGLAISEKETVYELESILETKDLLDMGLTGDMMLKRENIKLVRFYNLIKDKSMKLNAFNMIKAMSRDTYKEDK